MKILFRMLEPFRLFIPQQQNRQGGSDSGAVCLLKTERCLRGHDEVHGVRMVRRQLNSVLPANLKRRLAGILYADIARYSHLTEEDEDGTHRRVIRAMEIMTAHIRGHRGRISHYAGDAVLAEFRDTTSALHCAIDVQANIAACNVKISPDNRVEFRIGVNLGEIIADRSDIYGNAVNIAARLECLADPGGICVSDAVRVNTSNRLPVSYVSLGEQWVKNISSPVRAYRVEFDPPGDDDEGVGNVIQLRSGAAPESNSTQSAHKAYNRPVTE